MKYSAQPPFPTKPWRQLWENSLANVQALQRTTSSTIYVSLDFEGLSTPTEPPSEVGISAISFQDKSLPQHLPKALEDLREHLEFDVFNFPVAGRQPNPKYREPFFYESLDTNAIAADDLEDVIVATLENIRSANARACSPTPSLTLVGWDLSGEVGILSRRYPRVLPYFTSWVDLQELAKDKSGAESITLRECLLAFGIQPSKNVDQGIDIINYGMKRRHRACNDVVRIMVLLVHFLALSSDDLLQIERTSSRESKTARGRNWRRKHLPWYNSRQPPADQFPFVARVTAKGFPGRKNLGCIALDAAFSGYEPVALGSDGISGGLGADYSGWVCLSSIDELDRFVREVDGLKVEGGGEWVAVSAFDPKVTSATSHQELAERRESEANVLRQKKIEMRRKKREALASGTAEQKDVDSLAVKVGSSVKLDENVRP